MVEATTMEQKQEELTCMLSLLQAAETPSLLPLPPRTGGGLSPPGARLVPQRARATPAAATCEVGGLAPRLLVCCARNAAGPLDVAGLARVLSLATVGGLWS